MSTNSDSKFKISKWTAIGKMSIRPRTVRPWTADRPQHQELDSPISLADSLKSSGARTVRCPSADRPRQGRKRDRARRLASCAHSVVLFCSPLAYTLLCRVCADREVQLRADSPTACSNIPSTCLHHGIFKSCGFNQISSTLRLFGFLL